MRGRCCVAIGLAVVGAACSEPPPDPVAIVSVSLNRTEVPLGGPLEVTYSFGMFDTAPPFDEDYRVLVHFVDPDEELMWTDDHDPPVPTSEWTPGEPVTYTRTLFLPLYPYIGHAQILVGLYSTNDMSRVAMMGDDDNGQLAYWVESLRLLPQSENVFLIFQDGWYDPELSSEDATVGWRWTERTATIAFRNPQEDALLYLRVAGRPDLVGSPQGVTLSIGDTVITEFAIETPDPVLHKIPVSADQLGTSDMSEMRLTVDQTFVPAQRSASNPSDQRVLGIRVFDVFLEPRQ